VLLPAPDGPIMAVNSPDLNFPFTHFRMVLYPVINGKAIKQMSKMSSSSLLLTIRFYSRCSEIALPRMCSKVFRFQGYYNASRYIARMKRINCTGYRIVKSILSELKNGRKHFSIETNVLILIYISSPDNCRYDFAKMLSYWKFVRAVHLLDG